jgi:hypothetical protein
MSVAHLQRITKIANVAAEICCWATQLGGLFFAAALSMADDGIE